MLLSPPLFICPWEVNLTECQRELLAKLRKWQILYSFPSQASTITLLILPSPEPTPPPSQTWTLKIMRPAIKQSFYVVFQGRVQPSLMYCHKSPLKQNANKCQRCAKGTQLALTECAFRLFFCYKSRDEFRSVDFKPSPSKSVPILGRQRKKEMNKDKRADRLMQR